MAQIFLLLCLVLTSYLIPQKFNSSASHIQGWRAGNPDLLRFVDSAGLDHIFTTPLFLFLLTILFITLAFSSLTQTKKAYRQTFTVPTELNRRSSSFDHSERVRIKCLIRGAYLTITNNESIFRAVKHPWGYWGSALFHWGLLFVIISAITMTMTLNRGLLHMIEGVPYLPGTPWLDQQNGFLQKQFILPRTIQLDRVFVDFWPTDEVKELKALVTISDKKRGMESQTLSINENLVLDEIRLYPSGNFGNAFLLQFTDKNGNNVLRSLLINLPEKRISPRYMNFYPNDFPYTLQTKYFADREHKTLNSYDPQLFIRFNGPNSPQGEISLTNGESGRLGNYRIKLLEVRRWQGVLFLRFSGTTLLLSGFLLVILGVSVTYFTPAREYIIWKDNKGLHISWHAAHFSPFFDDERQNILNSFRLTQ